MRIGKFPYEVDELSIDDYDELITYIALEAKEEKAAQAKAKRKQS